MKTITTILKSFGYVPQHEPALHRHTWGTWSPIEDLAELAPFSWGVEIVASTSDAFKKDGFYGYMQYRTCKDADCGLTQQHPVCEPVCEPTEDIE